MYPYEGFNGWGGRGYDDFVPEGESATSWLTWSQRFVYQARACGFEAELIAVEREGLSVGADVFDGSSADPVRLRNTCIARPSTTAEG